MPTNFKVISRNIKTLHKPNPAFPVSSVISPYPPWESTTPDHSMLSQHAIRSQTSSCLCLCSSDLVFSHRERRNQVFRVCGNAFLWLSPHCPRRVILASCKFTLSIHVTGLSPKWKCPCEHVCVVSESLTLQYGSFFFISSCWISLRPWTPFCRPLSYRAWSLGISSCSTATISLKTKTR